MRYSKPCFNLSLEQHLGFVKAALAYSRLFWVGGETVEGVINLKYYMLATHDFIGQTFHYRIIHRVVIFSREPKYASLRLISRPPFTILISQTRDRFSK